MTYTCLGPSYSFLGNSPGPESLPEYIIDKDTFTAKIQNSQRRTVSIVLTSFYQILLLLGQRIKRSVKNMYLKGREKESTTHPLLITQMSVRARDAWIWTSSLELSLGLPHWSQGPKEVSHNRLYWQDLVCWKETQNSKFKTDTGCGHLNRKWTHCDKGCFKWRRFYREANQHLLRTLPVKVLFYSIFFLSSFPVAS